MKTKRFINPIHCKVWLGIFAILLCTTLSAQNIGINTTGAVPNVKAILDIDVNASATKMGLLVPRMTTTERNSITAPIPESLLIYNTTIQCFEAWNQVLGLWVTFGCIGCPTPIPPTVNAATSTSITSFTANWAAVTGATAYLLDVSTSPTFVNFVSGYNGLNVGNTLSSAVNSLTCGTTYYYRVKATNACGSSVSNNYMSVTLFSCAICNTQIWEGANINVGTRIPIVSAQSNNGIVEKYCYNDIDANCNTYGGLYQWNELMGYLGGISCDPCGTAGVQGICPAGYHVPTDLEWSRYEFCVESTLAPIGPVTLSNFQTMGGGRGTATGTKLKASASNTPSWDGNNISGFTALPAGFRTVLASNISLGSQAYYWTSTENLGFSWSRILTSANSQLTRNFITKTNGYSLRCILN